MKLHHILFLFIVCTLSKSTLSQEEYQAGYIVMNSGDTINGYISDRNIKKAELYAKVKFKSKDSRRKKKYSADQISAYGYGNNHFVSFHIERRSAGIRTSLIVTTGDKDKEFVKRIVDGKVSFYLFEFSDEGEYIDNVGYFLKENDDKFQRATQGIFGLKKKQLTEYFGDCPLLIERLNNNEFNGAHEVVNFYNTNCQEE